MLGEKKKKIVNVSRSHDVMQMPMIVQVYTDI